MSDAKADIIALSDYAYQRTRSRLAGLTDDEYFWEPVPGCCTVRRTDSGDYRADDADRPGNPPFTTIAWRLWHLIVWQDLLQALPAASWWEQLGPVAGPYAEDDKASLVLHQLDEQIHHGAELGVLRDLYPHDRNSHSAPER